MILSYSLFEFVNIRGPVFRRRELQPCIDTKFLPIILRYILVPSSSSLPGLEILHLRCLCMDQDKKTSSKETGGDFESKPNYGNRHYWIWRTKPFPKTSQMRRWISTTHVHLCFRAGNWPPQVHRRFPKGLRI